MTKERTTVRLFPSSEIGMFGRRQRHVRGHRIPVTLTRKAQATPGGLAIADTFGANDVAALPGGCPCCTVRMELQNTLRRVSAERARKPFSCLTIETERDLGPILRTFVTGKALGDGYYVEKEPGDAFDGEVAILRFTLTDPKPLSWDAFSRFVATLTALRGADLLHAKGALNIEGCRGPVAVELMGHLAARPVELQAWPEAECASRLEFITRGIDENMVRDLFDSIRAIAPSHTRTSS
jgi:G3E family GTPase